MKKASSKVASGFNRQFAAGILLALFVSGIFFGFLIYHFFGQSTPLRPYFEAAPDAVVYQPRAHDEYESEIEAAVKDLQIGQNEEARQRYRELAETIHGGDQWLLLKMSASANRDRTYTPLPTAEKPVMVLSVDGHNGAKREIMVTLRISNTTRFYMNIPQVPASVAWVFTNEAGDEIVIKGKRSLFGEPGAETVLKLEHNTFWGVKMPISVSRLSSGAWTLHARITYSQAGIKGLNVISGAFDSNKAPLVF